MRRAAAKPVIRKLQSGEISGRLERVELSIESLAQQQLALVERLADLIARQDGHQDRKSSATALSQPEKVEADELKIVKRKYRRAQAEAGRLRDELSEAQRQLALAKVPPTPLRKQMGRAISQVLLRMALRIPGAGSIIVRRLERRELAIIANSELLDQAWYLETYPDVAEGGLDPATHFLRFGWLETRDPGPGFSTSGYLKANPDVARSGVNPLIHFIEHGMAEGRSLGVRVQPNEPRSNEKFDPPASCVQFAVPESRPVRWRRIHSLAKSAVDPVTIDGLPVGVRLAAAGVLVPVGERFERLTGVALVLGGGVTESDASEPASDLPQLTDGWFVCERSLRMHWTGKMSAPRVVRVLQWMGPGGLVFVGEGLVAASPDFIDLDLRSALHPLLLVFATPEGNVVGADLLAFPSLFRGGLHHAELGAPMPGESPPRGMPAEVSRLLEGAWGAIGEQGMQPLLRDIRIDLSSSNGTEPIFRNELQSWLGDVMQIRLDEPVASANGGCSVLAFLADKAAFVSTRSTNLRSTAAATLILPAQCYPTISILVAAVNDSGQAETETLTETSASFICMAEDSALGALAAILPLDGMDLEARKLDGAERLWPKLKGAYPTAGLLTAIRPDACPLADARLLEPNSYSVALTGPSPRSAPITLMLAPGQWADDALDAALLALGNQTGVGIIEVCCFGPADGRVKARLEDVLGIPTRSVPDGSSFLREVRTELLLYLGAGVILHDHRTLAVLADLALGEGTGASGCPVLAHSRLGRGWSLSIDAAGMVNGGDGLVQFAPDVARFWNSIMPVAQLPADLWLARKNTLTAKPSVDARLVLTTQLTASYFGPRDAECGPPPIAPATAPEALRVARWLA